MYGQNDRDKVRIMNAKQLNKSFLLQVDTTCPAVQTSEPLKKLRPKEHYKG